MRHTYFLSISVLLLIFSHGFGADWDVYVRDWKSVEGNLPSRYHAKYDIRVKKSNGSKSDLDFALEIGKSANYFHTWRNEDSTLKRVVAANPTYSFELSRLLGDQDELSIGRILPGTGDSNLFTKSLNQQTYGCGFGLMTIPVLWEKSDWLAENQNSEIVSVVENGNLVKLEFVLGTDSLEEKAVIFDKGSLTLDKAKKSLPVQLRFQGEGEEITPEMAKMLIDQGVTDTLGKPLTMAIVGKSDDKELLVEWDFSEPGQILPYREMRISGNVYSEMDIRLVSANKNHDQEKTYLTYYGIAEPSGMPSRTRWRYYHWLIVAAVAAGVFWIATKWARKS